MRVIEFPLTYHVIYVNYVKAWCVSNVVNIKPVYLSLLGSGRGWYNAYFPEQTLSIQKEDLLFR